MPALAHGSPRARSSSSTSRPRAVTRRRSRPTSAGWSRPVPPETAVDGAFLWATTRRPGAPLVVLAGHVDTVPAQGNLPGRIENGAVHGLGASDMKGGVAVVIELARELDAERPPLAFDVALLVFGTRGAAGRLNPLPALFEASSSCARRRWRCCSSRPTARSRRVRRQPVRADRLPRRERPRREAVARRERDRAALEGLRPVAAVEPAGGRDRRATVHEVVSDHADPGRDRRQRRPGPGDRPRELPLPARPVTRRAPRRTSGASSRPVRATSIAGDSPPARVVTDSPLVQRLRAAGDLDARAEAGMDERRRLHRTRHRRRQLRAGRDRATPTAATSRSRSRPSSGHSTRCGTSSRG